MNTLPEFIKGIATAKDNSSIAQRREFVIKTYKLLLGKLANQKGIIQCKRSRYRIKTKNAW
ncbi:MAG: hypothetical protein FWD60_04155 [Candidatus Azobacteroides sp.]|nr:hypothetical protein [Candidatus Azobacteroides sp.]